MQGRVQLSCGHVDTARMIIHDDVKSGIFLRGGGGEEGQGRDTGKGEGWAGNSEQ